MRRKRKNTNTQMEETFCMNEATLQDYYYRFRKLATSIFEWVNLPSSMEPHYIEECLYYKGQCAFLFSNKYGYRSIFACLKLLSTFLLIPVTELIQHCFSLFNLSLYIFRSSSCVNSLQLLFLLINKFLHIIFDIIW